MEKSEELKQTLEIINEARFKLSEAVDVKQIDVKWHKQLLEACGILDTVKLNLKKEIKNENKS